MKIDWNWFEVFVLQHAASIFGTYSAGYDAAFVPSSPLPDSLSSANPGSPQLL